MITSAADMHATKLSVLVATTEAGDMPVQAEMAQSTFRSQVVNGMELLKADLRL